MIIPIIKVFNLIFTCFFPSIFSPFVLLNSTIKYYHTVYIFTTYFSHSPAKIINFSIAQNIAQKGASLLGESCSFGRKIYFITFSAYVLFTILLFGAFCVSSPGSVIINCSLSKLSSFSTGVSFHASMSL